MLPLISNNSSIVSGGGSLPCNRRDRLHRLATYPKRSRRSVIPLPLPISSCPTSSRSSMVIGTDIKGNSSFQVDRDDSDEETTPIPYDRTIESLFLDDKQESPDINVSTNTVTSVVSSSGTSTRFESFTIGLSEIIKGCSETKGGKHVKNHEVCNLTQSNIDHSSDKSKEKKTKQVPVPVDKKLESSVTKPSGFKITVMPSLSSEDLSFSPRILQYEKIKRLGHGASGTVWLANYNNMKVAVKEIYLDIRDPRYEYRMQKIMKELEAHKTLDHPYVIKFFDNEINRGMVVFITEYQKNGSIRQYLRREGPLDIDMTKQVILQTIKGLAHMHSKGIIHRDIKAANILISDDQESVKITDFGVSEHKPGSPNGFTNSRYLNGSLHWMAPEFFFEEHYNCQVDTWSVGCLVLELLTSKIPFIDIAKDVFGLNNFFFGLEKGNSPIPKELTDINNNPIYLEPELVDFLQRVLEFDSRKRPTCAQILENINDYPWLMSVPPTPGFSPRSRKDIESFAN